MGTRSVLAWLLARLSLWAIKKHRMKLVVVAGRYGTKITGELIGEMLSPEYVVRKQLERPFWDFSIPLTILGVDDRQYGVFQWIGVLLRSAGRLLIGRSNPTWTILQMSTFKKEIAAYWSEIITPDVLVLTSEELPVDVLERSLIEKTDGTIVTLYQVTESGTFQNKLPKSNVISVGIEHEADIVVRGIREHESSTEVLVSQKGARGVRAYRAFQKGAFMHIPLMLSIATMLALDFDAREVSDKLLHAQIELDRFIFAANSH